MSSHVVLNRSPRVLSKNYQPFISVKVILSTSFFSPLRPIITYSVSTCHVDVVFKSFKIYIGIKFNDFNLFDLNLFCQLSLLAVVIIDV